MVRFCDRPCREVRAGKKERNARLGDFLLRGFDNERVGMGWDAIVRIRGRERGIDTYGRS